MRILPVVDLMQRQVVRGVAGKRSEYRPIASPLASSADPARIAAAFVEHFGIREIYVADLDAIGGAEPARDVYRALARHAQHLWLDAGLSDPRRAASIIGEAAVHRLIVGLESISGWQPFHALFELIGPEKFVFSLDLIDGRVLSQSHDWMRWSPLKIALEAVRRGTRHLIVLDLAGVGVSEGPRALELCRSIRAAAPHVELISGGGVRGMDDVQALADAGCDAALVATALHDGRLAPELLRERGWL
jgi:phosphoribosylformimino-5-aminoimidazole carboxamide ribotide isomerase